MKYLKNGVYSALYLITLGIIAASFLLQSHPIESPLLSLLRSIILFFASILLLKYTVYMILTPWYAMLALHRRVSGWHYGAAYRPLVSVLIPAWNEEIGLLGTIKSLLASTYRPVEIVVINDGSTDGSDQMMHQFLAKYEAVMAGLPDDTCIKIIYFYQPNGGKGAALNTAIQFAHGDILLSIDADCLVDAHCVEAFVDAFRDPSVMAAVGNVCIGNTRTLIGTTQYLEYIFGFYFKHADSILNTIYIIGGAAGAFRREVFKELGGYSTTNITEDIELSVRIQERGWRIVYCPTAHVKTEGASTLTSLMKQRLRWKRGRLQTFIEHRRLFFSLAPRHNKLLTCLVLPLAIFGDMQLSFELLFIAMLCLFSFLSGDFSAFISGILVVSLMFAIQGMDGRKQGDTASRASLWLAPIGWLLFYVVTFVEVYALFTSLWMLVRKRELRWQKWQRQGLAATGERGKS